MPPSSLPRSFASARGFRAWLDKHHAARDEVVIRLFKVHVADKGLGYSDALDEALCYGWIDGVRHSVDANSFSVRFSPRTPRSIWSRVNVRRVEALIADGRMHAAGLAVFDARKESRTGVYSFERGAVPLEPAYERELRKNRKASAWFDAQAPYYRRTAIRWVMDAKREETRRRRLATLIACSANGARIPPMS